MASPVNDSYSAASGAALYAGRYGVPAWVLALPDGVWDQVGANTVQDIDPRYDAAVNPNHPNRGPWTYVSGGGVTNEPDATSLFLAWNGGAYDPSRKRWVSMYGGHGNYGGNEVIGLELDGASPTFVRYTDPSGAEGPNGVLDDGLEDTNAYADGRPRSIHSYHSLQAVGHWFYMASTPAQFRTAITNYGSFWKLNLNSKAWTRVLQETNYRTAGKFYSAGCTCYDSNRGRIYGWNNNAAYMDYYSISGDTVHTDTTVQPNIQATEAALLYIPELDIQVCLYKDYPGWVGVYDYGRTAGGFVKEPGATGDAPGTTPNYSTIGYDARMYPNAVWVPGYGGGTGAIVCWHGGRDIYICTPPSGDPATQNWAWSKRTISTGTDPGAVNSTGIWGRLFYDSTYKVLGLIKAYNSAPYWLKMPAAWF